MVETDVAVPTTGTFVFVAPGGLTGVVRRIVLEDIPTIEDWRVRNKLPCGSR